MFYNLLGCTFVSMKVRKEWKNKSGIYIIKCNNKAYIGSTIELYGRLAVHISHLRKNKHHSKFMQRAFNKYGEEAFTIEILEYCENNILILRQKELKYIQQCKSCFNSTTPITYEHSLDMKERISKTLIEKFKDKNNHPRYNKGIKYNIYDIAGNIIKEKLGMLDAVTFLKVSNPSVIRNLLSLYSPIIHTHYIIIKENDNYKDFIFKCINHKKGIMTIYQVFENGTIKKCTPSQNQKIRFKVFKATDFIYRSKKNKCYYTYAGLLKYLPPAGEIDYSKYEK